MTPRSGRAAADRAQLPELTGRELELLGPRHPGRRVRPRAQRAHRRLGEGVPGRRVVPGELVEDLSVHDAVVEGDALGCRPDALPHLAGR